MLRKLMSWRSCVFQVTALSAVAAGGKRTGKSALQDPRMPSLRTELEAAKERESAAAAALVALETPPEQTAAAAKAAAASSVVNAAAQSALAAELESTRRACDELRLQADTEKKKAEEAQADVKKLVRFACPCVFKRKECVCVCVCDRRDRKRESE